MSASSTRPKHTFGSSEKILTALFVFAAILGFLLTPLGLESRMNEIRTLAFGGFFIIVGLLLPIAGLVLMFRSPWISGIIAVIDAALLFLTAPADQALFFFTTPPPLAVSIGEFILIFVGIGYMLYGPRVYARSRGREMV